MAIAPDVGLFAENERRGLDMPPMARVGTAPLCRATQVRSGPKLVGMMGMSCILGMS